MATVLVTGCSSGFGEATVRHLATRGHRVYASMRGVSTRNHDAAARLRTWAASERLTLDVVDLDISSDDSVHSAVDHVLANAGSIDVVVNNAAIATMGPLEAFSIEQMASLLNVNVLGAMRVNKAVLPSMRQRHSGLIIWVTSTLGRILPSGGGGLYSASKWAAEGFAESLGGQVAPFGIDVVILEPGTFPTPAVSHSILPDDQVISAEYAAVATPVDPVKPGSTYRLPDVREIAEAVQQLIELPAGQRPRRQVVGHIFTEGVAEYNVTYERARENMQQALRRPDQAITWGRRAET